MSASVRALPEMDGTYWTRRGKPHMLRRLEGGAGATSFQIIPDVEVLETLYCALN